MLFTGRGASTRSSSCGRNPKIVQNDEIQIDCKLKENLVGINHDDEVKFPQMQ